MLNDTCAIIITYNPNPAEVTTLVDRISNHVALVLIIDNGSDNIYELRQLPVPVELMELGKNRGVATAQNVGIRTALERGYDYVLMFDHDSLPATDMVPKLREAFDTLSRQGIRVAAVGANYIERNSGTLQESDRRTGWVNKNMIISSGGMFSAEALRDVGLMQDDLFIDYVDTEWCMRAKRKWREYNYRIETQRCWKIYMAREALMGHTWSAGITSVWALRRRHYPLYPPIRQYYLCRNAAHLYLRSPYSLKWKLRDAISRAGIFFAVLLGGFPGGRWQYLRMMLLGTWHGLRGRLGPL